MPGIHTYKDYKRGFLSELRHCRKKKQLTVKEMSKLMSESIKGLTEIQARHYLEGRVPRDLSIRDDIINTFGLNRAFIEGVDPSPDYDPVEYFQNRYNSAILVDNYRGAHESAGRLAVYFMDYMRAANFVVDGYYVDGAWTFRYRRSNARRVCLMDMKARDYLSMDIYFIAVKEESSFLRDTSSPHHVMSFIVTQGTLKHFLEILRYGE